MNLSSVLNEASRVSPSQGDFTKTRNTHGTSDPVLFKMTMTASNFHAGLADLYAERGMSAKATWHRDMSSRLKVDANHFI
jgi:hypothetical protein